MTKHRSRCFYLTLPLILSMFFGISVNIAAQIDNVAEQPIRSTYSVELFSPWEHGDDGKATYRAQTAARSCFSLFEFRRVCNRGINISYGNRFGDNWDILALHGTQSRMVDLGRSELLDSLQVPYITPFRALGPGEKRHISVNTSGGDGADGKPGRNADGSTAAYKPGPKRESLGDKPVARQVSSKIETESEAFVDNYNPFLEAREGHVYAIRVLEGETDQYFLLRVDEVLKGKKIRITLRKVDSPAKRPVF